MPQGFDSLDQALQRLKGQAYAHWNNYFGFYSSWLNGYFREPWGMLLPMDEHGFHRGDGVFEAIRLHERAYFDLQAHLRRLQNSARAIGMELPKSLAEIEAICVRLATLCDTPNGVLRLFVTRGPGSFSPAPSEVVGHQIYAIVTALKVPDPAKYEKGCRAMFSTVAAKEVRWAQIKSCNYLQNVLMKAETVAKGYDMSVSLDERGRVCEGSTENLLIVNQAGDVVVPKFDYTLRGTTVSVVLGLAEDLKRQGRVGDVRLDDLTRKDLEDAREAAFVGTTLGVYPVNSFDGRPVGSGTPGPITAWLHRELMDRMTSDASLRTPF